MGTTTTTTAAMDSPLAAVAGYGDDPAVQAQRRILSINPRAEVETVAIEPSAQSEVPELATEQRANPGADSTPTGPTGRRDVVLRIGTGGEQPSADGRRVLIDATGWCIIVDPSETPGAAAGPTTDRHPGHPLAWLAAGAIGMAEVFRSVFAQELGPRGRTTPQPGGLNLLTSQPVDPSAVPPSDDALRDGALTDAKEPVDLGEVHLVGAGAIGQAAAYALSHLNATGTLHVVDPQSVSLSNLQRYLLTDANSVDKLKVALVHDTFSNVADAANPDAGIEVRPFHGHWGDSPDHLQAGQVLVALDTARDRITVAATEPQHSYNAWTQVADLGWSRHENFGVQPCLACLYYPDQPRPGEHELIAEALHQHPLRVLAYLIYNIPIGFPLPGLPALVELAPPEGSDSWMQVALVEDLIGTNIIDPSARGTWSNTTIGALYRDGICAGGLLPVGDLPGEVLVPLAHQSAFAGVMLAAELLWSRSEELTSLRDTNPEHRYDVLRGFPQVVARPRQRTPHCLCSDPEYVAASAH